MRSATIHKYDPITQKEFYQLFAFFNNVPENGLDGRRGNAVPLILLPSPAQQKLLDDLDAAHQGRTRRRSTMTSSGLSSESGRPRVSEKLVQTGPGAEESIAKALTAHYELDGSFSDISGRYQHGRTVTGDPTFDAGQIGRAATFDGDTEVSFGNVGAFDRGDAFSLAVWMRARGSLPMSVFQKLDDARHRRGYEWRLDDLRAASTSSGGPHGSPITLTSDAPGNAIQIRSRERLKLGELESRRHDLRRLGQGRWPRRVRQRQAGWMSTCCGTR